MDINIPWKFHQNVFTLTITFIVLNVSPEFVLIYRPHPVRSLAGRHDNPFPTRFLAPIDCYKIPAQSEFCRSSFY